ncbi:PAS domain-containing protein [Minwuia sp.]|uniref:PAS domain-containing protein n=1 Tax=Minwuia sp. TaxID=2493630 RepID=UPI003A919AAD
MEDVFESDGARKLFSYWKGLSNGGSLPLRKDFDPVDIPEFLRFITMIKPEADGDFTVALFGTGLLQSIGHEITGKSVFDESIGFDHNVIRFVLNDIVANGTCFITLRDCDLSDGSTWRVHGLTLPLADESGKIVRIATAFIPVTTDGRILPNYDRNDEVDTRILKVHRYEIATDTLTLVPYP